MIVMESEVCVVVMESEVCEHKEAERHSIWQCS